MSSPLRTLSFAGLLLIAVPFARSQETDGRIPPTADAVQTDLYLADISSAATAWRAGNVRLMESLLDRHIPAAGERDLRQFEWHVLREFLERSRPLRRIELPDYLRAVTFLPGGKELAVVLGTDHSVALVDAESGKIRKRFEEGDAVGWRKLFIAVSPDGTTLAYQLNDPRIVRLRNLTTGMTQDLTSPEGFIYGVEFSPDGESLATGSQDGMIRVWNLANGTSTAVEHRKALISAIAFSPDSQQLAVASRDAQRSARGRGGARGGPGDGVRHEQVTVYNLVEGTIRSEVRRDAFVGALAFSPDGKLLAIGGGDGSLIVYRFRDGSSTTVWHDRVEEAIEFLGKITSVAFSPDGKWLAAGGVGLRVWDTTNFMHHATFGGHRSSIQEVSFGNDHLLASAGLDHTVHLWDVTTADSVNGVMRKVGGRIETVAICPTGEIAANATGSPRLTLWDPSADKVRYINETAEFAVASSGILAAAYGDVIRFINMATGEKAEGSALAGVSKMAFSPNDAVLALGTRHGAIQVWDASTGEMTLESSTQFGRIDDFAFGKDGTLVAASHPRSGRVTLWNVKTRKVERVLDVGVGCGELSLDFSPVARLLAVGRQFLGIQIWDLTNEEKPPVDLPVVTQAVEFSADGQTLFSGMVGDASLHVWDLATHRRRCILPGVSRTTSIAVSGDGTLVAVGGWDGTIRLLKADRSR